MPTQSRLWRSNEAGSAYRATPQASAHRPHSPTLPGAAYMLVPHGVHLPDAEYDRAGHAHEATNAAFSPLIVAVLGSCVMLTMADVSAAKVSPVRVPLSQVKAVPTHAVAAGEK